MKNITISIDDALYQRVEQKAERTQATVSDVVAELVACHASDLNYPLSPEEFQRLVRLEQEAGNRITNFSVADNLPRDQLYDRKLFR